MRKIIILLLVALLVLSSCTNLPPIEEKADDQSIAEERAEIDSLSTQSGLSIFAVRACMSSDENNACYKLSDLGIVSQAECCEKLSKCC